MAPLVVCHERLSSRVRVQAHAGSTLRMRQRSPWRMRNTVETVPMRCGDIHHTSLSGGGVNAATPRAATAGRRPERIDIDPPHHRRHNEHDRSHVQRPFTEHNEERQAAEAAALLGVLAVTGWVAWTAFAAGPTPTPHRPRTPRTRRRTTRATRALGAAAHGFGRAHPPGPGRARPAPAHGPQSARTWRQSISPHTSITR
jgi:hypothetical protein